MSHSHAIHSVEAQLAKASETLAQQQQLLHQLHWEVERGELALAEFRAAAQVAALREWREARDELMAEARSAAAAAAAEMAASRRGSSDEAAGDGRSDSPGQLAAPSTTRGPAASTVTTTTRATT